MNKSEQREFEELDSSYFKGATMEYGLKIKVKKEVEDKIKWLTQNYAEEISAYLTGELKDGEVVIDGMLFPHQDVSSASVEVEPKNLIKLRKEYGDECLRIIGHWHSHNTMGAFWSSTDDEFIKQYSRTKDFCLFFVSSTKSRCRVMAVLNKPFHVKIDNIDYETFWESADMREELEKVIEEKVKKRVVVTQNFGYGCYGMMDTQRTLWDDETHKSKKERADELELKIKNAINYSEGKIVVKDLDMQQADTLANDTKGYNPQIKRLSQDCFLVVYPTKNKNKAVELAEELKFYLEEIFEEELNIRDYQNPSYYWG